MIPDGLVRAVPGRSAASSRETMIPEIEGDIVMRFWRASWFHNTRLDERDA